MYEEIFFFLLQKFRICLLNEPISTVASALILPFSFQNTMIKFWNTTGYTKIKYEMLSVLNAVK